MEKTDLRAIRYVNDINDNLICCICQTPFIEPVISHCGHTFCRYCISQAIEASPVCPIDRAALNMDKVQPAAKIISNMVNELLAYCPRVDQGCTYKGQRQFVESHLKNDCDYIMASCQLEECKELLLKKDLGSHAQTCKYRTMECSTCQKQMCSYELEDHYLLCPMKITQCPYCKVSCTTSDLLSHAAECLESVVPCPHIEFGCRWSGPRKDESEHISHCAYESIKFYLYKQQETENSMKANLQKLSKENETIKRHHTESQQHIETITHRLHLLFPGYFLPDSDIPDESIPSQSERVNKELEFLSAKLAALELNQKMALMTETFRLQDELQNLKIICQNLRMQMHFVKLERKFSNSSTVIGSNDSTPSVNNDGSPSTANKLRTWLDPSGSRQDTKL